MQTKIDYKAQGKANRRKGALFELKTRKYLEKTGWIVDKWTKNINLEKKRIVQAKASPFNRFNRSSLGFPDFIAFRRLNERHRRYELFFIECKFNGTLSKIEKQKMQFLKEDGHNIWTAYNKDGDVKFKRFEGYP